MQAARVHTERFCSNGGRWSRAGARTLGQQRRLHRLASPRTESGRSRSCGGPRSGWAAEASRSPPISSAADEQAWQDFLKAAVARYGPGGTYWATDYHQQFGAGATPLPIQSWQIWNEPNLKKYFAPGTRPQSAQKYATLLQISHDAIKSQDPQAQIVLAGMPGYRGLERPGTSSTTSTRCPGSRATSTPPPCTPTRATLDEFRTEIQQFRAVMTSHGDAATPLWLTEIAWGSGPPDSFGINKGLAGQAQC